MGSCSIRKCKTRSIKGGTVMFHTFPKNATVSKEWLKFCGPRTNSKNGRVCSKHFLPTDYAPKSLRCILMNEVPGKRERTLKPDAVPTLFVVSECNKVLPGSEVESQEVYPLNNDSEVQLGEEVADMGSPRSSTPMDECIVKDPIFVGVVEKDLSDDCGYKNSNQNTIAIPVAEYNDLKAKISALEKSQSEYNVVKQNLEKIFTPGQIRCLQKPEMNRVKWCAEDIAAALSLKCVSPNGYKYLKTILGVPLPGNSTLSKWEAKYHKRKDQE